MTKLRISWLMVAVLIAATGSALGQPYPTKTIKIVVPFSAGSISDGLARTITEKLAKRWGQQVIVENRPGLPGTTSVAKSAPDGYTLMLTSNGHTIAGLVSTGVQFDPVKDFVGITQVASAPLVVIAPPDLEANTLMEFIALAKQKPGELNFGSAGVASTSYLAAEILRQNVNINIQHVPYRGAPEGRTAVIRGDVQLYFASIPVSQQLIATGKVKAFAISNSKRVSQFPDVPTIKEAGVSHYNYDSWFALMAPAGTPRAILTQVSREIANALEMADVAEQLKNHGVLPVTSSPEQLDAVIKNDAERYATILQVAGVEPK